MSLEELNTKSLVVSVWDEDSKSRDDYMAGVNMQELFQHLFYSFFLV